MEEKENPLPSILLIVLFCTLIVLLGYAYLFNNDFFYSFCGGKSFWCSASQLLSSFPLFFILSIFVISAGVLYDVLLGAAPRWWRVWCTACWVVAPFSHKE